MMSRKLIAAPGVAMKEETLMADLPGADPDGGTPRWVKVFGILAIIVIVAFIVVLLVGGGHGPARHAP